MGDIRSTREKKSRPCTTWMLVSVAAAVSAALSAQSAVAQEKGTPKTTANQRQLPAIEEVVVLAQKREENIQSVPISITALSATALQDRQIRGLDDVANAVPGMKFAEIAGIGQISVRGVGFGLVLGTGENAVALHSDGVYISAPGAATMLQSDLAGIEVLRGPQGTLWGRNATGGVVNMISAGPTDHVDFGASALAGNYSHRLYAAHAGGPVTDSLRVRVSGSSDKHGGYIDNENLGGAEGDRDTKSGRLAVDADFSDSIRAQLRAYTIDQDSAAGPVYDPITDQDFGLFAGTYDTDPYKVRSDTPYDSNQKLKGGSLKLSFDLNDNITLTSVSGYSAYDTDQNYDADGSANPNLVISVDRMLESESKSQELDLAGKFERIDWILGAYYFKESVDTDTITDVAAFGQATAVVQISKERTESLALFGDATYSFTDSLRAYGGLRYTHDEKDFEQTRQILFGGIPLPGGCAELELSNTEEKYTGRLGGQYDLSDEVMLYAQVSTGYKSGGFATATCDNPFEPELLKAAEIGAKSTLFDGRLRLNGSAYAYDYDDLQYEDVVAPFAFVRNADARIYGAEVEWIAAFWENLTIDGSASATHSKYTKLIATDSLDPSAPTDQSGNPLSRTPEWQVSVGLQYALHLPGDLVLTPRVEAMASASYQTRPYDNPLDEQPAYELYNAYLTLVKRMNQSTLTLRAFGKNLGDEPVLGGLINIFTYRAGSYGMPRTYGVELSYRFGS